MEDFGTLINPFGTESTVGETGRFVSRMIGLVMALGGFAIVIYFFMGAIKWATAAGDKAKVEQAQKTLTNAVIGAVILVAAYLIIGILGKVLGFTPLAPKILSPGTNP